MTKDEFEIWKAMPETQEALRLIDDEVGELMAALASGRTIDTDSIDRTALSTAIAVGRIKGLNKLKELEHEDEGDS